MSDKELEKLVWRMAQKKLRIEIHDDNLIDKEQPIQKSCIYWMGWKGVKIPKKKQNHFFNYVYPKYFTKKIKKTITELLNHYLPFY